MDRRKILMYAILHAVCAAAYVGLVAFFMTNVGTLFGPAHGSLNATMFLLMFVISAAVMGMLVFGRPALWYLDNMKREAVALSLYTVGFLALIAALVFGFLVLSANRVPGEQVFCTMEAKLCPDGSYVGRIGPKCEFAECPTAGSSFIEPRSVEAGINETVNALDVSITPLAVLEDSRCAVDVQCVWAGTVHVRARLESGLGTSEMVFSPDTPVTTEAESITLTGVSPAPYSKKTIAPADYRFTFEVSKR